jgi:superfamily II DNA or RNA helicase
MIPLLTNYFMFTLRPHQQRGCDAMTNHNRGQLIMPTGAGKTLTMITDAQNTLNNNVSTIVVVCPRILLAEQLCSEFLEVIDTSNVHVMHCHSGETHHFKTTNPDKIHLFANTARTAGESVIIFTTYNSLNRIQQADIEVNTIYFDEAHNSVKRHFFPATEFFSQEADRCYFFTATRKTSVTINKPGMNDREVYGDIICRVSAPELVNGGFIIPPKIQAKKFDIHKTKKISPDLDCNNVLETIDDNATKKILVCVRTTKQLINLMTETDFAVQLNQRGYSFLYITAKTGAVIDGKKVNREVFFDTLNAWGKDPSKKFVCLHRSILSEGINVSQLETVVFLRNMDVIEMTQTIGRVLRLGGSEKKFGLCVVPVYSQVGIATERALQNVVNTVFEKGELLDSVVRR